MSARSVCSGTRPSWYPSTRAISAPPRRPPHLILIPPAPMRMALCTARFMARRNEMRCASWLAMLSATSWASSSGRLISSTLIPTSLPQSGELVTELIDFRSLLADDDARTTGVNRDDDLARLPLDADVGDRRVTE